MVNILQTIKDIFDGTYGESESKAELESEIEMEVETEVETVPNSVFKPKALYKGCYNDDPSNLIMETELKNVSNVDECIALGEAKKYKWVSLTNGNNCRASNNIKLSTLKKVDNSKCNSPCEESNSGYCGGTYKNQIYATRAVENFNNVNNVNKSKSKSKINKLIYMYPIENYIFCLILTILTILIYVIVSKCIK